MLNFENKPLDKVGMQRFHTLTLLYVVGMFICRLMLNYFSSTKSLFADYVDPKQCNL